MLRNEVYRTMKVALPIILGNMSQMVLGMIDSAMIGAIDYVQLAASALVMNVLGIPYVFAIGMSMAISPLVAIANGKNDQWSSSHYLFNGVILCTIIAIGMSALIHVGHDVVFHLGQDPEVAAAAIPYLKIMGWSVIPMIFFLSLKHFSDALEHTKVAMVLSLLSLPINAFLNWIMIYGHFGFPRMELEGAGWATLITRIIIAIALLIAILHSETFKPYVSIRLDAWKIRMESWKEIAKIGIPSSLQYGMEVGAFTTSGIIVGWFGAEQLAAHQIALISASLTFMVALGLSQAGSIRVSNALGRGDWTHLKRIGHSTLLFGLIMGAFFAALMVVLHQYIPFLFNKEPAVVELASILLLFAAVFQISDAGQAIGVGLLRGVKDVSVPTLFIAIAYWLIGLPTGYLLSVHFNMQVTGIWIGFVTGLSFSAILTNFRFRKIVERSMR